MTKLTDTRADVLRLIAEGKHLGDYVPRYRPGARRGRQTFPVTTAIRAADWLAKHGFVRVTGASVTRGSNLEPTDAGIAELRAIDARAEQSRLKRLTQNIARRSLGVAEPGLGLTEATDAGHRFRTGEPVVFTFVHNTEKAPRAPRGGQDQFQQRIEPAGFYMLVEDPSAAGSPPTRGWMRGEASFRSPIVLLWNTGAGGYDESSWKARLSRAYGGKRGKQLSRAILRDGHDAVVTVDERGAASEIVDLSRVR